MRCNIRKLKLTKAEKEVLHLLHIECLTPKQIAKKRKISNSAVYKFIRKLKEKGFFNENLKRFTNNGVGMSAPENEHPFRLHGQRFYIEILDKTENYLKKINKIGKGIEYVDGNYVTYNEKFVQIMGKKDFWAETPIEAEEKSLEYWTRFILKLEQRLRIVLLKDGYDNIRYSKSGEFAETNNELAKDFNNRNDKLMIRGTEDNKVWLVIDNSFNLNEMETTHSKFSMDDSIKITDHFNDIRNLPIIKLSEISQVIGEISRNIEILSANQNLLTTSQTNTNSQLNAVLGLHKNLVSMLNPKQKNNNNKGGKNEFNPLNSSMFM